MKKFKRFNICILNSIVIIIVKKVSFLLFLLSIPKEEDMFRFCYETFPGFLMKNQTDPNPLSYKVFYSTGKGKRHEEFLEETRAHTSDSVCCPLLRCHHSSLPSNFSWYFLGRLGRLPNLHFSITISCIYLLFCRLLSQSLGFASWLGC